MTSSVLELIDVLEMFKIIERKKRTPEERLPR